MHAFGLEETNFYREAERIGKEAQERNPTDIWAVHAVAHVYEMEAKLKEGIEVFLEMLLLMRKWNEGTKSGWKDSFWLAPHVNWHTALYNMELEHYDEVLRIYDHDIKKDTPSMLVRMVLKLLMRKRILLTHLLYYLDATWLVLMLVIDGSTFTVTGPLTSLTTFSHSTTCTS